MMTWSIAASSQGEKKIHIILTNNKDSIIMDLEAPTPIQKEVVIDRWSSISRRLNEIDADVDSVIRWVFYGDDLL